MTGVGEHEKTVSTIVVLIRAPACCNANKISYFNGKVDNMAQFRIFRGIFQEFPRVCELPSVFAPPPPATSQYSLHNQMKWENMAGQRFELAVDLETLLSILFPTALHFSSILIK